MLNENPSDFAERDRALFNTIAAKYARKDLKPAPRIARRARLEQTFRQLPRKQGLDVLEVGCGAGYGAAYLEGHYSSYLGVDYAAELIDYANEFNKRPGVEFEVRDVETMVGGKQFDVIFMIGVLHHLDKPQDVLRQLRDLLKPGGWMVANEPQRGNPIIGAARAVRKKIDPAYSEDQREYSPDELKALYVEAGYEEIKAFPQGLLSTPFAEVVLPLQPVAAALSKVSCVADSLLESMGGPVVRKLAWNVVVQGRRPA